MNVYFLDFTGPVWNWSKHIMILQAKISQDSTEIIKSPIFSLETRKIEPKMGIIL